MVLILLSTIPPCTPTSAAPFSPRSTPSSASSPFFAILSPLFDQSGPEDEPASPRCSSPMPSPRHIAYPNRPRRVPSLLPAPLRTRPASPSTPTSAAARRVDKLLPPTPHSPAQSSPLRPTSPRSHRRVPSVNVSVAPEVVDASGSHVVRTLNPAERSSVAHTPPPTACPRSPRSMPLPATPATPGTPAWHEAQAVHRTNLSMAMSGIDLDVPPTPRSAPPPNAAYDGVEVMDVPLAIDSFLLRPAAGLWYTPPPAPLLAPAPPPRQHRKAASTGTAWRRPAPLSAVGQPRPMQCS